MKNIILLLTFFLAQTSWSQPTTIYMIRHAEKEDASANPNLSEEGKIRAEKWKSFFKDIPLDVIYTTDYNRTRQTALPIASSKMQEVVVYHPSTLSLEALAKEHRGKALLVVGHSNSIPAQINTLLDRKEFTDMKESEFGNLYTIVIDGKEVTSALSIP